MMAKSFITPNSELAEGNGGFGSAGEVDDSIGGCEFSRGEDLVEDQGGQVAWVEAVADLVALAIEADVAQRPAAEVAINPVGEDSLVGTAELPRAGHDSAAVDENLETESLSVFQGEHFAGKFRGAVEGDRRLSGKGFIHASRC